MVKSRRRMSLPTGQLQAYPPSISPFYLEPNKVYLGQKKSQGSRADHLEDGRILKGEITFQALVNGANTCSFGS